MERTHASFFSGVGGLDLGLERAGWRTVSFSEIDPYACAVLAERWPDVPNLGDIVEVAAAIGSGDYGRLGPDPADILEPDGWRPGWADAALWTGGFPCQDLSIAGKRRGLAGSRSGLAFAFLELVERHRPPWVLLENVPGLLSSNRGRDLAVLLGRLAELGYGVAWRVLDARYFGVAQRRRRVFILATRDPGGRAGADRAAEVLSIAASGGGHPATGGQAGPGTTGSPVYGVDLARAVTGTMWKRHDEDTDTLIARNGYLDDSLAPPLTVGGRAQGAGSSVDNTPWFVRPSPDARGDGAADGLAGRAHDRQDVGSYHQRDRVYADLAPALDAYGDTPSDAPMVWVKGHRASSVDDDESWRADDVSPTLNAFDVGDVRSTTLTVGAPSDDPLLPLGLDSHRYRCCGNGIVSNVAEAIGRALVVETEQAA